MSEPKIDKMIEAAKNRRGAARQEMSELVAELNRENNRIEMPYAIIYIIGLLSLMAGAINILSGGIDLVNGVAIFFGGFTTYDWHQSDKRKKSLREKISILEKAR